MSVALRRSDSLMSKPWSAGEFGEVPTDVLSNALISAAKITVVLASSPSIVVSAEPGWVEEVEDAVRVASARAGEVKKVK